MKKYLTDWDTSTTLLWQSKERLRIEALEPEWDLSQGWHPDLEVDESFYEPQLRKPLEFKAVEHMPRLLCMPPQGAVTGHVMMRDAGPARLVQPNASAPIAPIFVRDLAGRIIYVGTTRHKNTRGLQPGLMPKGSILFDESNKGFDLLERVFFCSFRPLEPTVGRYPVLVSGQEAASGRVNYMAPNLYPYKLRLDTFYQDGWRIPQVERLFVVPTPERQTSDRAAQNLMKLWQEKPENSSYEDFVEQNESALNEVFSRGCTLIPTFEAFNGFNKVDDNFNHTGFWPGRAVVGLHDVVTQEDSDAPQGTIVKVLEPGYVTENEVRPARVIVSNGQSYKETEAERYSAKRPKKLYPDLRLPHQRLSAKWGATWLPQHPADFEEPAVWGWDEDSSGRFVQLRGPVWDPLHYYYDSVTKVAECHKKNRLKKNINLVRVPDEMLTRFYPIADLIGYDSFDIPKKEQEELAASLVPTALYRVQDEGCITKAGYHPMPIEFEYELDNWWFPDLAPKARVSNIIPLNVESHLVRVIRPNIPQDRFVSTVRISGPSTSWVVDPLNYIAPRGSDFENFPELQRYLKPDVGTDEILSITYVFLEEKDEDRYPSHQMPTQYVRAMESSWPGLYQTYLAASRRAKQVEVLRYKMFENEVVQYAEALWNMVTIDALFDRSEKNTDPKKDLPSSAVSGVAEY